MSEHTEAAIEELRKADLIDKRTDLRRGHQWAAIWRAFRCLLAALNHLVAAVESLERFRTEAMRRSGE